MHDMYTGGCLVSWAYSVDNTDGFVRATRPGVSVNWAPLRPPVCAYSVAAWQTPHHTHKHNHNHTHTQNM